MSNNHNKIVFSSILGAILATGLLALNPSMIGNAQAEIEKIKCVNSNINVNGIDITHTAQGGPDPTAVSEAAAADAANTQNANGLADRINFDRNLVNICVNVNENEQKVTPPETTLSVKKTITCDLRDNPAPEEVEACQRITTEILPEYFTIFVSGNNPNPDIFSGSMVPEIVTLGPGDYVVSETRDENKVDGTRADIERDLGVLLDGPAPKYSGDCKTNVLAGEGEGTIAAGESQVCNIENLFRFT